MTDKKRKKETKPRTGKRAVIGALNAVLAEIDAKLRPLLMKRKEVVWMRDRARAGKI